MEEFKLISLPSSTNKTVTPGSTQQEDSGDFKVVSLPKSYESRQGILGSVSRAALGVPLRLLESAVGSIGDLRNAAKGLISHATGGKPQSLGISQPSSFTPPTSEDLRNLTRDSRFSNLTEPQGYFETVLHDVASDIGSLIPTLAISGGASLPFDKIKSKVANFAAGSAIGNSVAGLGKKAGLSEGWQGLAKIGGHLGWNLKGYKNALEQLKKERYAEIDKQVANATHDSSTLHSNISKIHDSIKEGASKDKKRLLAVLKPIAEATESGNTSVSKVLSLIKDINGNFADRDLLDRSKKVLGHALDESYKFINSYNPEIYKKLVSANDIHKGFHDVSKVGEYLNKHTSLENIAKNPLTKTAVWGSLLKGKPGAFVKGLATAGGLYAARGVEEFRNLLAKSPDAWKTLGIITQAALENNTPNFIRGVTRLDKIIEKIAPSKKHNED